MQIRDLTVIMSLWSHFANKSVCSPYTSPFSGLQLRPHSRVRRIKWEDFWHVHPLQPNAKYCLFIGISVSWDKGESLSFKPPHPLTRPKVFLESDAVASVATKPAWDGDWPWIGFYSKITAPAGYPTVLAQMPKIKFKKKWQCQYQLIVNHYYNERFETLIVTHFLELRWRPGTVK